MDPLENLKVKIYDLLENPVKDNEYFEATLTTYLVGKLPRRKSSRWRISVIFGSWSVNGSLFLELSKKRDRSFYQEKLISDIDDYGQKINISYETMINEFIDYLSNINEIETGPYTITTEISIV